MTKEELNELISQLETNGEEVNVLDEAKSYIFRLTRRVEDQEEMNKVYRVQTQRNLIFSIIGIIVLFSKARTESTAEFIFWLMFALLFSLSYKNTTRAKERSEEMLSILRRRLKEAERRLESLLEKQKELESISTDDCIK